MTSPQQTLPCIMHVLQLVYSIFQNNILQFDKNIQEYIYNLVTASNVVSLVTVKKIIKKTLHSLKLYP